MTETFEWPIYWRNAGCDSDFSKYPLQEITEEDTIRAAMKVLVELKGAHLLRATEDLHTMLARQENGCDPNRQTL